MDDENAVKMELRKSRKRNGERERIDGEFLKAQTKNLNTLFIRTVRTIRSERK